MGNRIGQQLGNYRLIRLLGQGSFAEVYLGEQVDLKTQVAIKMLHTRLAANNQESFLSEMHTIATLSHPHIARILEAGVEGDTPFLIMEYIPLGSLRDRFPRGTHLPSADVVPYVKQVSAALQDAHDHKLIHRNVKPENMLLGPHNNVLLTDFSIALISQSSRSQDMREMAGAVAYMAPEQLKGKPCPATDQYALGIVIYEWLSGDYPFHGSFSEIANQHAFVPPPPLHEKVPEISSAVEEVVQIALAKDPKLRFASMQAFANALEQASKSDQPPLEARTFFVPDVSALMAGLSDNATQPFSEEHSSRTLSAGAPAPLPAGAPAPLPIPSAQQIPSRRPRLSRRIALALVALALLVVAGSIGLIYYAVVRHPALLQGQSTAAPTRLTVNVQADTNAQATAAAFANAEALVTATAQQNLYVAATSGSPVIDDMLLFNNGNRWSEGASSRGEKCAFTAGAYHVIEPQQNNIYNCFANATNFGNFAIQARVTIIKGDLGGLLFLADNAHANYCFFGVQSDGSYRFYCYVGGSLTYGLNSEGKAVGQKSPQSNLLTVIVRSNYIFLYVNKQYVASIKENFLSSGEIGMFAIESTQPTDVAFNHVQAWNL